MVKEEMHMFDLIIKNATVITVDPDHSLYQPGFVAVIGSCSKSIYLL